MQLTRKKYPHHNQYYNDNEIRDYVINIIWYLSKSIFSCVAFIPHPTVVQAQSTIIKLSKHGRLIGATVAPFQNSWYTV